MKCRDVNMRPFGLICARIAQRIRLRVIIRNSYSVTAQLGIGSGGRGLESSDAGLDLLHKRARLLRERGEPV